MEKAKRKSPTKMLLNITLNAMNKKHPSNITSVFHCSLNNS